MQSSRVVVVVGDHKHKIVTIIIRNAVVKPGQFKAYRMSLKRIQAGKDAALMQLQDLKENTSF